MQYVLKIIYLDDKDVSIILEEKQVPLFIETIKKNEPFWQNEKESAFYVPLTQIRYMNIQKIAEKTEEAPKEEPVNELLDAEMRGE